jgi:hypothetical protein
LSAPLLELPNPVLEALHSESQSFVAEFMGVAQARQRGHGALVLSASDLKSMPDDIDDGAEQNDDEPNGNVNHEQAGIGSDRVRIKTLFNTMTEMTAKVKRFAVETSRGWGM